MKAKEILKKLDYVPRWVWYMGGLFVAPPVGLLAVYLVFHALDHAASIEEQEEQEERKEAWQARARRQRANPGNVVSGDGYEVRDAGTEDFRARGARANSRAAKFTPINPEAGVDEVLRRGREALSIIRDNPGLCAYDIAGRMKWKIRAANWDEFPVIQKWFAVGECFSHLDYHLLRGAIRAEEGADGLVHYYAV